MKTKIIPFDLDTAMKIQAGEIEGKIKTSKLHNSVRLLCDDFKNATNPEFRIICAILRNGGEYTLAYDGYGRSCNTDEGTLVLEVPDNEPQFKPFDKVLVRNDDVPTWTCSHFSHIQNEMFICENYSSWKYCIPYDGNEHLVGTTDKPKEE